MSGTTKRYTKCGEEKPVDEFYTGKAQCKACRKAVNAAWYLANKERCNAVSRAWHAANKDKASARHSAYYFANADRLKARAAENCISKYGKSRNWYDQQLADQDGGCAVCGSLGTTSPAGVPVETSMHSMPTLRRLLPGLRMRVLRHDEKTPKRLGEEFK